MFEFLALNIGPLLAGLLIWYIVKNAFKWAPAGPWGAIGLMFTVWLVVTVGRILFLPTVDVAYVDIKGQVRGSELGADAARLLGQVPKQLGFTETGAQSQLFSGRPEGQVPTFDEQPSQIGVGGQETVVTTTPTVFEFASPVSVTPVSTLLVLEYLDGRIVQVDVTGTTPTACGIDLRRMNATGQPTHAYACPTSDGVTFAISQVTLPTDWPQLPVGLLQTAPEGIGGGGEGVPFDSPDMGQCIGTVLIQKGISHSSEYGANWLPAGSSWTLISPNWSGRAFTLDQNETWTLISNDWDSVSFPINGELSRQMGGKTGGGKTSSTVIGTGPIPSACR